ncbi:hypothetical protein Clacol_009077 [Clathrus columnatus]|uniref:Uncharacterized protein n=1 Tax=Clathrus columnatus TaxID=1419009 RepID=A0AAV5ANS2_9AGAM|nr:hypothetical protein Clacol_009077 [Clathrus columnatus]
MSHMFAKDIRQQPQVVSHAINPSLSGQAISQIGVIGLATTIEEKTLKATNNKDLILKLVQEKDIMDGNHVP